MREGEEMNECIELRTSKLLVDFNEENGSNESEWIGGWENKTRTFVDHKYYRYLGNISTKDRKRA